MDAFGLHPYGDNSSQPPTVAHTSTTIALADYGKLVALLGEAFDGTAQPGSTLPIVDTPYGRLSGLTCWENYMPLAPFALYESGREIDVASTADDGDAWQATLVHLARESRAFVVAPCHFQRAESYPDDFPLRAEIEGAGTIGRGGSAILSPDGSYLAGPLYGEEGILYAELDPARLHEERPRFDPAGH